MALYEGCEWFFFLTSIRTFLSFRDGSYYSLRCAIKFKRICPTHICQRHPPTGGPRIILIIPLVTYIASQLSVPWSLRLPRAKAPPYKSKSRRQIYIYTKVKIQLSDPPQIYTGCPKCVSEYCWRPKILTKIECCGAHMPMNKTLEHWPCFLSKKLPNK